MYHAYTLFATYCHPAYLSLFTTGGGHGSLSQSPLKPRREHKRLKHWGKKNKKLRDKTPYSEENGVAAYVAYSTNRPRSVGTLIATGGGRAGQIFTSGQGIPLKTPSNGNLPIVIKKIPGSESISAASVHTGAGIGTLASASAAGGKVRRHDPRQNYGTPYIRAVHPHHQNPV